MRSSVVFSLFLLVSIQTDLYACENWVAKVVSVNGLVEIRSGSEAQPAQAESVVCPGQTIAVAENSRAAIYLSNNSFVRLDQNTVLNFPNKETSQGFWVKLQKGVSHFISRITQRFVVDAPYVNAAVDGTEFLVTANENENSVTVVEGKVTATSQGNQQAVTMGQKLLVSGEESTFRLTDIKAEEVIDWAVYYSPVPTLQELYALGKDSAIKSALSHIKNQRSDLALVQLENAAPQTEAIQVAKAAVLLSVGQSKAAQDSVRGITSAQSLALKSVIQSTRNNVESALQLAQQAVQKDEQSLSALLALSYAHQANLDLPSALDAARKATLIGENDSIAWARVSEMELAMGNIQRASKAIKRAQKQDASNPYVITQAGFIQLFRIKISNAKELFRQAIAQDSENPQAHLGLGLALLREGEMAQGRKQLEYATSLDPARSVVRSYLGRAYFEEKRDEEAATQWELAKQLDPNDPTPYFYEGVRKLFANDPIGAIEELEASRQLNNERALYRSETLLQSDAASRSATLARAYDEVGYDQGVLLSGWDALKNDPTSAEGHRLLADYYRGNSRYETARASELLQSQLWQPLSAYPLQPQLSETGISVVEGAGPQNPGFNEYHSLFTQDGVYGAVNGYGGSDNTWGDDLVGSFLAGPVAVSLGQYHFETDGWRENSGQEQDMYSGFIQWAPSPETSFQMEARKLSREFGDLAPRYFNDISIVDASDEQRELYRFGVYQKIGSYDLIATISKKNTAEYKFRTPFIFTVDESDHSKDATVELQILQIKDRSKLIFGVGGTNSKQENSEESYFENVVAPVVYVFDSAQSEVEDLDQRNSYFYYMRELGSLFDFEVGLAYDSMQWDSALLVRQSYIALDSNGNLLGELPLPNGEVETSQSFSQWSPKIGLGIKFDQNIQIRTAAYRTFRRAVAGEQFIEPAFFMGFPQFFEDEFGNDAKNFGVAVDFVSLSNIRSGLSYLRRLNSYLIAYDDISTNVKRSFLERKTFEDIASAYMIFSPSDSLLVSVDLNWDQLKSKDLAGLSNSNTNSLAYIDRYTVPVKLHLFSDSRASVLLSQTYFYQRIRELQGSSLTKKNAWISDMAFQYRFGTNQGAFKFGVNNILDESKEFISYNGSVLAFYPARYWYMSVNVNI